MANEPGVEEIARKEKQGLMRLKWLHQPLLFMVNPFALLFCADPQMC